ncbi:hypothetical protein ECRM12581_15435 [Escherichia coli O145:H28 str. RM12581]|uniref:Transposase n=1 Tax=Escherichia coli O145:H28 (strain RM12581) TaxID=1248823 RepID=A0ABC7ZUN0_ECOLR|nr:hypothetical protein ECRM13514_6026 [Escherichia coli O145:H28 str. RM13514]AHY71617.1 hypothetical protein ECRM12581_15435 [Escherichia coli O145:H28 str. RM12581]
MRSDASRCYSGNDNAVKKGEQYAPPNRKKITIINEVI